MNYIKDKLTKKEIVIIITIYMFLAINAIITKDSCTAIINAFCGITYTFLAGKGFPICYLFGVTGSTFYCYLAFINNLWGNLLLYGLYYIPMQITGYFKWNMHLKKDKKEIIKSHLDKKESIIIAIISIILSIIVIYTLKITGDKSPIIDGITTILSIAGMYLTVRRCIEQWLIWIVVNGLSFIMWLNVANNGQKVYSTVFMWFVYFMLSVYFYFSWKKEIKEQKIIL